MVAEQYRYNPENRRWNPTSNPYTREEVTHVLNHPIFPKKPMYATETPLDLSPRINTGLPAKEALYIGPWYHQGNEATCLPWAVANAMLALNIKPPPGLIRDLLNYALNTDGKEEGIMLDKARELITHHPENNILLQPSLLAHDLNPDKPAWTVKGNAILVKDTVDKNTPLLVSLQREERDRHTVCITGYTISEEGFMSVQVIDSARRGIAGYPIETLSKEIVPASALAIMPS
jgi:hypothetical protein